MSDEPPLAAVAVAPAVAEEHPGLRAWSACVDARPGRTPPELRARLRLLADRFRGAEALALRTRPVPAAYRVLFRHLGLDPDVTRTPVEALAVERLLRGGLPARGLPEDALVLATLETGVPVWACDAARSAPSSSCAPSRRTGGSCWPTPRGRWRCSSRRRCRSAPRRGRRPRCG